MPLSRGETAKKWVKATMQKLFMSPEKKHHEKIPDLPAFADRYYFSFM